MDILRLLLLRRKREFPWHHIRAGLLSDASEFARSAHHLEERGSTTVPSLARQEGVHHSVMQTRSNAIPGSGTFRFGLDIVVWGDLLGRVVVGVLHDL